MSRDFFTPRDLVTKMLEASRALDDALAELNESVHRHATAERRSKTAMANAYLATEGTVQARAAHVDKVTELEQYEATLAEGLWKAAQLNVRSKQAQLSALQSVASSVKAEAELARVGA